MARVIVPSEQEQEQFIFQKYVFYYGVLFVGERVPRCMCVWGGWGANNKAHSLRTSNRYLSLMQVFMCGLTIRGLKLDQIRMKRSKVQPFGLLVSSEVGLTMPVK